MIKKRSGQLISGTTAVLVGLGLLGVSTVAGTFFIDELTTLLELIISNVFYVSLVVLSIIGGLVLLNLSQQGRISTREALAGFLVLMGVAIAAPLIGFQLGSLTTTYVADVTVLTSQGIVGIQGVAFSGVSVDNVRETGPQIFSVAPSRTGSIINTDWRVDATLSCPGELDEPKELTFWGSGGGRTTQTVEVPGDAQCFVEAEMVRPDDHSGIQGRVRTNFVTP